MRSSLGDRIECCTLSIYPCVCPPACLSIHPMPLNGSKHESHRLIYYIHLGHTRPTLYADSSRCRTQRSDWYSISVDLIISRMHLSASIGCPKGPAGQDRSADLSSSPCLLFDSHLLCCWHSHMERSTGRRHLSTIFAQFQKTTKTASVSTFIPWPCFINY